MIDPELAQQIVESSTDFAIITLDANGIITSWNPGAESIMGWSPAEVVGQHGRLFFTEEDQVAGSPEHEMERALSDGRAIDERFHLRRDGSRFWGSGLMMALQPGPGFLKIVRDRTREREAERRLMTLTDAMPGFVLEADADGHYVQTNARFKAYTGRTDAELLGDRWQEAIHPKHRSHAQRAWAKSVETGEPFEHTFMVADSQGEYRCFSCRGIPRENHG
jgi:PAS domain S-box-containing protein